MKAGRGSMGSERVEETQRAQAPPPTARVEALTPTTSLIHVAIPAPIVDAAFAEVYAELVADAVLQGIRARHAQRSARSSPNRRLVHERVIRRLGEPTMKHFTAMHGVVPVALPHVVPGPLAEGQAFGFHAEITHLPRGLVVAWEGLDLRVAAPPVDSDNEDARAYYAGRPELLGRELLERLLASNRFDVPAPIIAQERQRRALLRAIRGTPAMSSHEAETDAEDAVRAGILFAAIAKAAGVVVTETAIEAWTARAARELGKPVDEVRARYRDHNARNVMVGFVLEDIVMRLVVSKSTHPELVKVFDEGGRDE